MNTLVICVVSALAATAAPVPQPPEAGTPAAAKAPTCAELLPRFSSEYESLAKKLDTLPEDKAKQTYDEFVKVWKKTLRPHLLRADQMDQECWRATGAIALMDNDLALASHAYEGLTRLKPAGLPADFMKALKEGCDEELLKRIPKAREQFVRQISSIQAAGDGAKDADLCDVAEAYAKGEAIPNDDAAANIYFAKAADKGNSRAMWRLGARVQVGVGCENADRAKGLALMVRSADAGDPTGLLYAGRILIAGYPGEQDKPKGVTYLTRGAEAGDAECANALARFYHAGEALPKDDAKALSLATRASSKSPEASLLAAQILRAGTAGKPDPKAAVRFFQAVADGSDDMLKLDANTALGDMLIKGEGFDKPDHDRGVELLTSSMEAGDSAALLLLAKHYASGDYLAQDEERAAQLWTKGDDAQVNEATYYLSIAYRLGKGVDQDTSHADALLERAAKAGYPQAVADLKKKPKPQATPAK